MESPGCATQKEKGQWQNVQEKRAQSLQRTWVREALGGTREMSRALKTATHIITECKNTRTTGDLLVPRMGCQEPQAWDAHVLELQVTKDTSQRDMAPRIVGRAEHSPAACLCPGG